MNTKDWLRDRQQFLLMQYAIYKEPLPTEIPTNHTVFPKSEGNLRNFSSNAYSFQWIFISTKVQVLNLPLYTA